MKVPHDLLLQVQRFVRVDLLILDDVGELGVGRHHREWEISNLLPPPLDNGGHVEPNQERDDLRHVPHQKTPSFEPESRPESAFLKILQIHRLIGRCFMPILWWAHLVSLEETLDGEVDDEIDQQNQNVSHQNVLPPMTG